MEVARLTDNNIEEIRNLYNSFLLRAKEDYLFELPPLDFVSFKDNFANNFIKGYYCKTDTPKAFLLYSDTLNQAIEITLIYTVDEQENYLYQKALVEKFSQDMEKEFQNKVISYPMLGIQNQFTQDITNLGFKPIGEMVVEFDFSNQLSKKILEDFKLENALEHYEITNWKNAYIDEVSAIIHAEFSKLNDAKFDPRFRTLDGTKTIINEIINGFYGEFNPKYTTILLKDKKVAGCCLVNFSTEEIANIPLIALNSNDKNQGLGLFMLKNSASILNQDIQNKTIKAKVLNATCDTENPPAIKSYRKAGFKEKTYYTHAYKEI